MNHLTSLDKTHVVLFSELAKKYSSNQVWSAIGNLNRQYS
jgi:hypothetical protein